MSNASILKNLIDRNTVNKLSKGSRAKTEIKSMQNILKTLGYGNRDVGSNPVLHMFQDVFVSLLLFLFLKVPK